MTAGRQIAAAMVCKRDRIFTPVCHEPAEVTHAEQPAPGLPVLLGYRLLRRSGSGWCTCPADEAVTVIRCSPARAA